jgi:thiol-disulfide isomerase/thioredoxin
MCRLVLTCALLLLSVSSGYATDLAAIPFQGAQGSTHTLSESKGKRVLFNIWATWCTPCVAELPALDRLQRDMGGKEFEVMAVSVDRKSAESLKQFFIDHGVIHLTLYHDASGRMMREVSGGALPVSVVIDASGKEIEHLTGKIDWDDPTVREQVTGKAATKTP